MKQIVIPLVNEHITGLRLYFLRQEFDIPQIKTGLYDKLKAELGYVDYFGTLSRIYKEMYNDSIKSLIPEGIKLYEKTTKL